MLLYRSGNRVGRSPSPTVTPASALRSAPRAPASVMQKLQDKLAHWERAEADARVACSGVNVQQQQVTALQLAVQMVELSKGQIERERAAERQRQREQERAREAARLASLREPPSLQALVEQHGTFDRITQDAWKDFRDCTRRWQLHIASGDHFAQLHRARRQRTYAEAKE